MPDRNAAIVVSLRNQASPEIQRMAADAATLVNQLRATAQAAGQSEEKFLELAGALSRDALAAGDAARAEQILAAAMGQANTATEVGTRATLQQAQAEARLQAALGDRSGAAKTIAAELARQEQRTIGVINAERQLVQVQQQGTSFGEQFGSSIKSGLLGIVGPAAIATAAISAVKGAADLAVAGEQVNKVDLSFQQLARSAGASGDAMLAALRKASGGEITDLNIKLATNKGLLLGVAQNTQTFAALMEIARDRAQKMGITTEQAYDNIITGIGRESPRILDNIGIVIDADAANEAYAASIGKTTSQLTKVEKEQALANAVIKQGKASLDPTTQAVLDQENAYTRLATAIQNAKDKAGAGLNKSTQPVVGTAATVIDAGTQQGFLAGNLALIDSLKGLAEATRAYYLTLATTGSRTQAQIAYDQTLAAAQQRTTQIVNERFAATNQLTGSLIHSADATNDATRATQQSTDVLSAEANQKLTSTIQSAQLADEQKKLADDSKLAALGLLGSGDQALILANKYGIAAAQAQFLINQQQQLTNAQALADQRAGERSGGAVRTEGEQKALTKARQLNADYERDREAKAKQTADRIAAAQQQYDLARARTPNARIAVYQRELAQTTDQAERLRIQAQIEQERNSAAKSHTGELNKQLTLQEGIYDSVNKQAKAEADLRAARAQGVLDTLKEDKELKTARAILASANANAEFKQIAQAKIDLIQANRDQRRLREGELAATAGASIINGKLYQSRGGGASPGAAPAAGGPIPAAPASSGASGGAAGAQTLVLQLVDGGKVIAQTIEPFMMDALLQGINQVRISKGA